ncbi:MAG: recombination-associated protein RdgC [Desulfovibrionaceae bacterium]|nr:recombination-associated protein RdgC [Desulfovibrionaceae bacterium]
MSGFIRNNISFTLCRADAAKFSADALRKHVFTPDVNADGKRLGWVGLGDPLDEDFAFGVEQGEYAAFSLRLDSRTVSGAAVKLQLAEAVRKEEAAGKKVGASRKKELKENITAALTAKAEFVPSSTDCLWDLSNDRLFVAATSSKQLQAVFGLFKTTFGIEPMPTAPKADLSKIFAEICRKGSRQCNGFTLSPFGSASLATPGQAEEKALVSVQNNLNAILSALDEGLNIQKLRIAATSDVNPDLNLDFTLDAGLAVSGLRLPKADKDADQDAEFSLLTSVCSNVADLVETLAGV